MSADSITVTRPGYTATLYRDGRTWWETEDETQPKHQHPYYIEQHLDGPYFRVVNSDTKESSADYASLPEAAEALADLVVGHGPRPQAITELEQLRDDCFESAALYNGAFTSGRRAVRHDLQAVAMEFFEAGERLKVALAKLGYPMTMVVGGKGE